MTPSTVRGPCAANGFPCHSRWLGRAPTWDVTKTSPSPIDAEAASEREAAACCTCVTTCLRAATSMDVRLPLA